MFGAISLDNRQIFRQYDRFNENTFYEFLKTAALQISKMLPASGQSKSTL